MPPRPHSCSAGSPCALLRHTSCATGRQAAALLAAASYTQKKLSSLCTPCISTGHEDTAPESETRALAKHSVTAQQSTQPQHTLTLSQLACISRASTSQQLPALVLYPSGNAGHQTVCNSTGTAVEWPDSSAWPQCHAELLAAHSSSCCLHTCTWQAHRQASQRCRGGANQVRRAQCFWPRQRGL